MAAHPITAKLTIWHNQKKKEPPIEVYGKARDINELRNFIIRRCKGSDKGTPAMAMIAEREV
jgi:hypothetical protein